MPIYLWSQLLNAVVIQKLNIASWKVLLHKVVFDFVKQKITYDNMNVYMYYVY